MQEDSRNYRRLGEVVCKAANDRALNGSIWRRKEHYGGKIWWFGCGCCGECAKPSASGQILNPEAENLGFTSPLLSPLANGTICRVDLKARQPNNEILPPVMSQIS
jgi:hypothetical protein